MDTVNFFKPGGGKTAIIILIGLLVIFLTAVYTASLIQTDFGNVEVGDVFYKNYNGLRIRAKLFRPVEADEKNKLPGVVYIHGYQNNRETGDAYCIETARRGFVVLNIDAIGRGHSDIPGDPEKADFDSTYGGKSSIAYLKSVSFVRADSIGIMGHSLGAEMAYKTALEDSSIRALVITGFAYTLEADRKKPKNMLMIIGKYDEYRGRMTGTTDILRDWMDTDRTKRVFPAANPRFRTTYGDFSEGTARRVYVPPIIHIHESHHGESIAETVEWLRQALNPPRKLWKDASGRIWYIKEWMTLIAMLSALGLVLPLGYLLLSTPAFASLRISRQIRYWCGKRDYFKYSGINGILLWMYLPAILILFGLHKFVVRIDTAFPMMMVNAIVWWFFCVNGAGLVLFIRWYKKKAVPAGVSLYDLGISPEENSPGFPLKNLSGSLLLALFLFVVVYGLELFAEKAFIVNFRFIFPFMNDLTPYRVTMFFLYLPFLLFCFIITGFFLHGQIRPSVRDGLSRTFISWSGYSILALCGPIILFLMVQYIPLFAAGFIPFVGPNGLFVAFIINLMPILAKLAITCIISSWFYLLTGSIYTGAFLNSFIITWIFASSQVIAPIPV